MLIGLCDLLLDSADSRCDASRGQQSTCSSHNGQECRNWEHSQENWAAEQDTEAKSKYREHILGLYGEVKLHLVLRGEGEYQRTYHFTLSFLEHFFFFGIVLVVDIQIHRHSQYLNDSWRSKFVPPWDWDTRGVMMTGLSVLGDAVWQTPAHVRSHYCVIPERRLTTESQDHAEKILSKCPQHHGHIPQLSASSTQKHCSVDIYDKF